MTPLTAAGTRSRLGSHSAALAIAAVCAFVGCSAGGNASPPPNTAAGGTSSGGTVASGGSNTATGGTGNGTSGGAGAAQGGAMGSAGGGGTASLTVGNSGGKYSLGFGQTYIEVDPTGGARITALRTGGATGMNLILDS